MHLVIAHRGLSKHSLVIEDHFHHAVSQLDRYLRARAAGLFRRASAKVNGHGVSFSGRNRTTQTRWCACDCVSEATTVTTMRRSGRCGLRRRRTVAFMLVTWARLIPTWTFPPRTFPILLYLGLPLATTVFLCARNFELSRLISCFAAEMSLTAEFRFFSRKLSNSRNTVQNKRNCLAV